MEVLQFVIVASDDEVLHYILGMNIRNAILDTFYIEFQPIHMFFLDNFYDNALVFNKQELIAFILEAGKFLQESQKDEGKDENNEE